MRVFGLTTGADTAGIGVAIKSAFERHAPDWHVDCMVASQNYIAYQVDVPWSQLELERLYDAADVVHIHNTLHAHRWYDNSQGKPTVLMHHGIHSLAEFREIVAEARNARITQVCSTLDMSLIEPVIEWLPTPVDLVAMALIREAHYEPGPRLRIGHAPTNRAIKGSDAFDRAIATLAGEGLPVEAVVIEKQPWSICLAEKATCEVFWDQPVLGYGSNAIEAWAMGMPVLSGVADPVIRAGMIERWGSLPFFEASEATLTDALREMVKSDSLRAEYTRRGSEHVRRWHDDRVTVESLKRIYADARPSAPGGNAKRDKRPQNRAEWRRAFNTRMAAARLRRQA